MESKVYFQHTSKSFWTKFKLAPPSTIAIKKVDNQFIYGVAICGDGDNFSKTKGRELSEERLTGLFGRIMVPERWNNLPEHKQCLWMLKNLTDSIVKNPIKWKKKLYDFNNQSAIEKSKSEI